MLKRKMLHRKVAAGAPHAGHHFVRDQQHAIPPANIRDRLQVSWWRRNRSKRSSAHRLKDKRRHFPFGRLNRALQLGGVLLPTVTATIRAIKLAAITIW